MGWDILAPLIATQGLNVAAAIWQRWESKQIPTAQDWVDLKAIAVQDAQARMGEALIRAGITMDNPKAAPFMALVTPKP